MEYPISWIACAIVLVSIVFLPAAFLVHRKLRQEKIAAKLKINSALRIDEEQFVRIGGIDQWISVRGEDRAAFRWIDRSHLRKFVLTSLGKL